MIYQVHHIKSVTIISLFVSALFLFSYISMAQDKVKTETFTLTECINIALESNLQLAAARKRLEVANTDRIKASLLLPTNPNKTDRTRLPLTNSSAIIAIVSIPAIIIKLA